MAVSLLAWMQSVTLICAFFLPALRLLTFFIKSVFPNPEPGMIYVS
jgi:hypothetical protein